MFRNKSSKLKYLSNVQTLDELHNNYLAKIQEQKMTLPDKRKKLQELENELKSMACCKNTEQTYDIKAKSNLKSEIMALSRQIMDDEGDNDILDYMSKVGEVVVDYYSFNTTSAYNMDQGDDESSSLDESDDQNESETKGIYISDRLKHLNQISQQTRKIKKAVKKRRIVQENPTGKSILNFFKESTIGFDESKHAILNKATLQDKYLMLIDKSYACDKVKTERIILCSNCKIEKTLFQSEGCYICKSCGETEHIIMESEMPGHKEIANEKQKYPYKKINHLKEKLNQFQSKESADIPDEICEIVKFDLKKIRVKCELCTPYDIKQILKKHKLTNYYEHLQQIYSKISGAQPILLSRETEEKIIGMFQGMQDSFHKHCPTNRSNFLSYSYVLNKLFKILKMFEHAKYFNLLKSKEKLREQDIIWKKICADMGWVFYSSF